MELWGDKVLALFMMGLLTLGVGLLPIWLLKRFRSSFNNDSSRRLLDRTLSLLNCFVGGVFLSTTLLHMIPEAREATEIYLKEYGIEIEFAVAEFTVAMGFFIVMILEHIVMVCRHKKAPRKPSHMRAVNTKSDQAAVLQNAEPIATMDELSAKACQSSTEAISMQESLNGRSRSMSQPGRSRSLSRSASLAYRGSFTIEHNNHHDHHQVGEEDLASVRSFVLLLAISIHTLFEGLAIGLQPTWVAMWSLFLAIIIHKLIIAFSLGLQFAEHLQQRSRAILFIVVFSILSPIGIAVATTLTALGQQDNSSAFDVVNGVLQGISSGTLLYVAFFEVLMGEVGNDHCLLKVLCVILGFTLMTLVNLFNHE